MVAAVQLKLPRQHTEAVIHSSCKTARLTYTHQAILAILACSIQGPEDVCSLHAACASIRPSAACMLTQQARSMLVHMQRLLPQLPCVHELSR